MNYHLPAKILNFIRHMNIMCDSDGFIYFNELFYYLMKFLVADVYTYDKSGGKSLDEFREAKNIMKK